MFHYSSHFFECLVYSGHWFLRCEQRRLSACLPGADMLEGGVPGFFCRDLPTSSNYLIGEQASHLLRTFCVVTSQACPVDTGDSLGGGKT